MVAPVKDLYSGFEGKREEIIPLLQRVQEHHGFLSDEAMDEIARFTRVPASNVYAVATFFAQFRFEPLGRNHIMVCRGTACHVRGAEAILDELIDSLGLAFKEGPST